ncbi:MAG: hypothetical protein Q8O34_01650 [Rhodocyclaceae bacterium]|nr:hypothetical protein [Rhodocyclaceae bacterium]
MMTPIHRQEGFVLATALMILVAMTLIGLALIRAVDTTNAVANNIAFKHSTLNSTDVGTEDGVAWLEANKGSLTADQVGYYARAPESLPGGVAVDYTGQTTPGNTGDDVDWDGTSAGAPVKARLVTAQDAAGNQVAYVIHRLCDAYGSPGGATITCAKMSLASSGGSKGGGGYGTYPITSKTQIYYRITTRALGPRNTTTHAQAMVVMEY